MRESLCEALARFVWQRPSESTMVTCTFRQSINNDDLISRVVPLTVVLYRDARCGRADAIGLLTGALAGVETPPP